MHDLITPLWTRLVPDDLWAAAAPLIPPMKPRAQGGGRARVDDRVTFTAVVYILASGSAWRALPDYFGVSVASVYRRHQEYVDIGLWPRLLEVVTGGPEEQWVFTLMRLARGRVSPPAPPRDAVPAPDRAHLPIVIRKEGS